LPSSFSSFLLHKSYSSPDFERIPVETLTMNLRIECDIVWQ
jgi:hypothetical protein